MISSRQRESSDDITRTMERDERTNNNKGKKKKKDGRETREDLGLSQGCSYVYQCIVMDTCKLN